jgi:hypothetical protein
MQNDNILKDAIAEAKVLRNIAMKNAKYSLKNFLMENNQKLPLQSLTDLNHLSIDEFVDAVLEKERAEEDELNPNGLPYLNNQHKKRKQNTDDDLDERSRFSDEDDFELDYGDGNIVKFNGLDDEDEDEIDDKADKNTDEKEDEENFSDNVVEERGRKWKNLYGRRNFKSSPAIISSGVGSTKLSQHERNLLLKHAGLTMNKRTNLIKECKDNLIRQRAGIKNLTKNNARQVVSDLEIKKKLSKQS